MVGGVDDAVERLGGVRADGQQADVVDDDKVRAADPGDGAGGGPVDLGLADRSAEGLQGEPGHSQIDFDRGLGQALGEVAIAGAHRPEQDHVLAGVQEVELSEVLDGSIHMTCQPWPSRSKKLREYMKPWSSGPSASEPPAASAASATVSTSSRADTLKQ